MVVAAAPAVATPTTPTHAPGERYLVPWGMTLSDVAAAHGVSTQALADSSGVDDRDVIYAGTYLTIPAGSGSSDDDGSADGGVYVVSPGETIWDIATANGLAASTLAEANGLADPDLVVDGVSLIIPSGGSGAATASTGSDHDEVEVQSSGLPSRIAENPDRLSLEPIFDEWAATYGVPADLVKAVGFIESGWQSGVVSPDGAMGIGQVMPGTVDHMEAVIGTELDPWSPNDNIRMSARYLSHLLDITGGDTETAVASYYQGYASVQQRGLYTDTMAYVDGVLGARDRF